MKTVKDKYLVVGADFAGYPLKEAVVAHLKEKGWKIEDLGVVADSDPDDTENMFHRVGLRVGADLSSVYEWWHNFYEFHKLAIDELEAFDYEEYKKNGFKMEHLGDFPLKLEKKPE